MKDRRTRHKPHTSLKQPQTIENTPKAEKAEEKPNTKQKKQAFSFQATELSNYKAADAAFIFKIISLLERQNSCMA